MITGDPMYTTSSREIVNPQALRLHPNDRRNVTKEDMQRLLDHGFVPFFAECAVDLLTPYVEATP